MSECSSISSARSCRAGSTVERRGFGREVHAVTLGIVVVDGGGIVLTVFGWEFQAGGTMAHSRVIAGCANRLVKVGIDFLLFATAFLTLDKEEDESANDTKTDQADNSKSPSHGTFVFQETFAVSVMYSTCSRVRGRALT